MDAPDTCGGSRKELAGDISAARVGVVALGDVETSGDASWEAKGISAGGTSVSCSDGTGVRNGGTSLRTAMLARSVNELRKCARFPSKTALF